MRVAFVSNVVYPFVKGGAEKRIHEIGTRLAAMGHEVTIYGRHFWDGPPRTSHEGMNLRAVSPERDLYADDRRSITEAIEFAVDLYRPLRHDVDDYDLVVASVFPYFPVLTTTLATLFRDTPVVTTWHEVWGDYWEEYLGRLAPAGKLVERVTARVPQHPVAVSEVTADRLARLGPPRDRIEIVPNGIDVEQIRSIPPANDGFDVLFAGRLIPEKNVGLLLDAFDRVAANHDATLGIVGDGPERSALERRARSLDSAQRVTFLGFLEEYEDVLAQMRGARVFAAPSVREGFGITVLEAMAADCTVIAADHPDSAAGEVLDGGGFLVEPTVDGLASALDRSLEGAAPPNDPLSVARHYDWDRIARRAEDVYRDATRRQ